MVGIDSEALKYVGALKKEIDYYNSFEGCPDTKVNSRFRVDSLKRIQKLKEKLDEMDCIDSIEIGRK